jgi:hypothetical protein
MTVPPYVIACLFTIGAGYAADRAKQRGVFMMGFELVAIVGFTMLISSGKPAVQYVGTFFAASGKSLSFRDAWFERDQAAKPQLR